MLKIGVTGGMGSGKTTVCRIFSFLGIPVFHSDEQAKKLMQEDESIKKQIRILLGSQAYKEGILDRSYVAKQIFSDAHLLRKVNAVIHPAVAKLSKTWHESQENTPFSLQEAALIYETGGYLGMDAVIVVTAPLDLRLHRIMTRDQINLDQINKRIENQWSDQIKVQLADFLIQNDGKHSLIIQVLELYRIFAQ